MPMKDVGFEETKPVMTDSDALEKLREAHGKIISVLRQYCDLPENYYPILAVWVIGTYCHQNFSTYPYLFLNAMRGSGKTRLLKLLSNICNKGEIQANISEAVLFRTANKGTILIDEFEQIGNKEKGILRELLNAGYKKGIKVKRMKKVTKQGEEDHVVQEFDLFTPIVMANIFGVEEVLADRCLTLILEKSSKKGITRMIEDFEGDSEIQAIRGSLNTIQCSLCSVVTQKNIVKTWNNYITQRDTDITTLNYTYTQTTPLYIITPEQESMFSKVYETDIDGRNLELYFPLFILARIISEQEFDNILSIAKEMVNERKNEETTESKDVLIYNFVAHKLPVQWYNSFVLISDLTHKFKEFVGSPEDELEWLNSKWVGRALKRLNLVAQKRRLSKGIEVLLDDKKAKQKVNIFKSEESWSGQERRTASVPVEVERRKQ